MLFLSSLERERTVSHFPVVQPTIGEVDDWHSHPQELQRYVYEKLSIRMRLMFVYGVSKLPPMNENDSSMQFNFVCELLDDDFVPSLPLYWLDKEEILRHNQQLFFLVDPHDFIYVEAEEVLEGFQDPDPSFGLRELWHKKTWLSFTSDWTKDNLKKAGYELVVVPVSVPYWSASHTMGCKARRI